jgi:predicted nucleotidyltransferase component of viral defense system
LDEPLYPASTEEIDRWRKRTGTSAEEARRRYIQYVVLELVASDPILARSVVFKGGNALRFAYGSERSTMDLDFSARETLPDDDSEIRARLDHALRLAPARFRVKARCQRIRRNPPGREKTLSTYQITIAYLLATDSKYKNFDNMKTIPSVLDLEISLNEVVCEIGRVRLRGDGGELVVCSIEDILAEKLRALLQQPIRNRSRPQDVFDIAGALRRFGDALDLSKISRFLLEKSRARDIDARKGRFDDSIKSRAAVDYVDQLGPTVPELIPFEEAWAEVSGLVSRLEIPD